MPGGRSIEVSGNRHPRLMTGTLGESTKTTEPGLPLTPEEGIALIFYHYTITPISHERHAYRAEGQPSE